MLYVYKLYIKNELIYIGKTKDLKGRLIAHRSDRTQSWKREIDRVEYATVSDENTGSIYEIYYINRYKPKYNKQFNNKSDMKSKIELNEISFIDYRDIEFQKNIEALDIPLGLLGYVLLLWKFSDSRGNIRNEKNKILESKNEIAKLVGVTRKSISTNFKKLEELNLIKVYGKPHEDEYSIKFNINRFNELFT